MKRRRSPSCPFTMSSQFYFCAVILCGEEAPHLTNNYSIIFSFYILFAESWRSILSLCLFITLENDRAE